jgi:hypothetical protein
MMLVARFAVVWAVVCAAFSLSFRSMKAPFSSSGSSSSLSSPPSTSTSSATSATAPAKVDNSEAEFYAQEFIKLTKGKETLTYMKFLNWNDCQDLIDEVSQAEHCRAEQIGAEH